MEAKNQSLDNIVYNLLKFMPMSLMNVKGCQ
jgi:hypothetical protein